MWCCVIILLFYYISAISWHGIFHLLQYVYFPLEIRWLLFFRPSEHLLPSEMSRNGSTISSVPQKLRKKPRKQTNKKQPQEDLWEFSSERNLKELVFFLGFQHFIIYAFILWHFLWRSFLNLAVFVLYCCISFFFREVSNLPLSLCALNVQIWPQSLSCGNWPGSSMIQ